MEQKSWHILDINEIYKSLNSSENGLSTKDAIEIRKLIGKNQLSQKKKHSLIKIFFRQFLDPIILLLSSTVVFSFIANEVLDAIVIFCIILVNLLLGLFQEWKAEKTMEKLSAFIKVMTKTLRDNETEEIDSIELVPGDIIFLESGSQISADCRIIECHNFTVDESVLTGESIHVSKREIINDSDEKGMSRSNLLYAGTFVVTGRAKAIVIATGSNTEFGKIADQLLKSKPTKSPLTIRTERFSKQIALIAVGVGILLAFLLYLQNVPGKEIFLAVIALSVSAIPEGLPLATTLSLSIASNRMSKKQVIVKKLNSVESLGSCTIIASDKTGTLTVNQQTAKMIVLPSGKEYQIEGNGYSLNGNITNMTDKDLPILKRLGLLGVLNNEAKLEVDGNNISHSGDAVDVAFLVLGKKLGISDERSSVLSILPYESERKYSAVSFQDDEHFTITLKGSFETILNFCDKMLDNEKIVPLDKEKLLEQHHNLARKGFRMIAIAEDRKNDKPLSLENLPASFTFLGIIAFLDPIKDGVKESIEECHTAGIKVIMITGDHPLTAFTIAKDLHIAIIEEDVATGDDLENAIKNGTKHFDDFISSKTVFSRITPLQKLEIVNSYKRSGAFIAMTGDGVNDAPAIKTANIGIAMGSGSDVTKETASMILLDDNFKSIVTGVREGRTAYGNIRKVSYLLLSCGFAEVFFFLLSVILKLPMPLVAIQLLWLNIVTNGVQDIALSFEKEEDTVMEDEPRSTKESLFNKDLVKEVLLSGVVIGAIVLGVWYYLVEITNMEIVDARSYIMLLMVFLQNLHTLNCRSEKQSAFKIPIRNNLFIVMSIFIAITLQIIMMSLSTFRNFLKIGQVPILHILFLLAVASIILWVMEIYKYFLRKNRKKEI